MVTGGGYRCACFCQILTSLLTLLQDRMAVVRQSVGPYTVAYAHQPGNGLGDYIRLDTVLQINPQYT